MEESGRLVKDKCRTRYNTDMGRAKASVEDKLEKLREEIRYHEYRYYVLDEPAISPSGQPSTPEDHLRPAYMGRRNSGGSRDERFI